MEFIQIKSTDNPYFEKLLALYADAFPENQRHSNDDYKRFIESAKDIFYCNAVLLNGSFVGFFNYWNFGWFLFAEHFAIEEAVRGNKLGEKVMKMIKSTAEAPLVFEVELPDNELNARRIEFYSRLGYQIVPVDYLQPPYNEKGFYQPLHLMTDDVDFVVENYDKIKNTIYKNVYGAENVGS